MECLGVAYAHEDASNLKKTKKKLAFLTDFFSTGCI